MRLLTIICFLFASFGASAAPRGSFPATVAYVIDAATYVLDVNIDGKSQRIRLSLAGIEAPKIYRSGCEQRAAITAKQFVNTILWQHESVIVSNVHLDDTRFKGDILFEGRDLANVLLTFKQARAQDIQAGPWCQS